ncbi:MAG: hypothetical protein R3A10_23040 [Caldilineaceae bacterium]
MPFTWLASSTGKMQIILLLSAPSASVPLLSTMLLTAAPSPGRRAGASPSPALGAT